ncbi:MAG: hypothetical protein JWP97_3985 [Labilithrix sp.]|nr:hypothetical protein [Labilithrix sp.]
MNRAPRCFLLIVLACSAGCASQTKLQRGVTALQAESAPDELMARGDQFAAVGDMTRAEQYFAGALRSNGDAPLLVRRLVAVCAADGRYPVALEYADDYLRNHPRDVDVRFAAATLRIAVGDEKKARTELALVLGSKPAFADAHYTLALLEKGDGDVMAADREFRAYLAVSPEGEHREVARENLMRSVP